MVIVDSARLVVGGVDTHRDLNVAAVVDMNGGLLGVGSFPTTADGHRALSSWMSSFGTIERVGIEGTGAYGAGVARHFIAADVAVIEAIDRTGRSGASAARAISSTRSRQRAARCRVAAPVEPSRTRTPKRYGRCSSPNDQRARPAFAPLFSSVI